MSGFYEVQTPYAMTINDQVDVDSLCIYHLLGVCPAMVHIILAY